ncbi:MAG: HEPN domain-containing protein [Candidatus Cloacimonetes bacterium]|nr:HEPN domain-containing protein [Candidatus Cloacimonadota bacterium]
MTQEDLIGYWEKTAAQDIKVAEDNFKLEHYNYALFFCHLFLERILKALYTKRKQKLPPPIHNLTKIAKDAGVEMDEKLRADLDEITTFNVAARYDNVKLAFYKKATREFAKKYMKRAKEIYLWLKKQL